jgi:ubiquinone/menaquinone biosynthesis C-methylase UbiE
MSTLFRKIRAFGRWCVLRVEALIQQVRYRNEPEKIVSEGYDKMAADYGKWTLSHRRPDRDKYTQLLIDQVPAGAKLLELGCGPGDPTTKTLAQHFEVTANDISEGCLALARKNAPSATFILSDMTELEFQPESFDAVVAYYAFHHIPRDRYEPLLKQIYSWLSPGGHFMAALYPYDVENLITEDWHGSSMYWSSFDAEKTVKLVTDCGLTIREQSMESAVEDGKETTFLWLLANKPAV